MKQIQEKSVLLRVSEEFELPRVRVIGGSTVVVFDNYAFVAD